VAARVPVLARGQRSVPKEYVGNAEFMDISATQLELHQFAPGISEIDSHPSLEEAEPAPPEAAPGPYPGRAGAEAGV
jgi:hypothetical protein